MILDKIDTQILVIKACWELFCRSSGVESKFWPVITVLTVANKKFDLSLEPELPVSAESGYTGS